MGTELHPRKESVNFAFCSCWSLGRVSKALPTPCKLLLVQVVGSKAYRRCKIGSWLYRNVSKAWAVGMVMIHVSSDRYENETNTGKGVSAEKAT